MGAMVVWEWWKYSVFWSGCWLHSYTFVKTHRVLKIWVFHLYVNFTSTKNWSIAPAGVSRLVGGPSCNWKVAGSTPGQDAGLGCRPDLQTGTCGRQLSMLLSCMVLPSLPSSLSKSFEKMSSGKDKKILKYWASWWGDNSIILKSSIPV